MRNALAIAVLMALAGGCAGENAIRRGPELPRSTPWNLTELSKAPKYEWVDSTGPVRSLLYAGEEYQGKPTRIFAYYATPGSISGDASHDKNLSLIHI